MKKYFIPFFVFVLSAFGIFSLASAYDTPSNESGFNNLMFSDVDLAHENYDAIYFLYNMDVIEGYATDTEGIREYRPDNAINRAEFLKLLLTSTDVAVDDNAESCFPDVLAGEWFTPYVCKAKEEGWISGYPDNFFRPDQTVNEAEALKMLGEVMDWELCEEAIANAEAWYSPYVDAAQNFNILIEEEIANSMTRGDIAEMMFRNLEIQALSVSAYSEEEEDLGMLFEFYEIPYNDPFGPGELFGPGGPFGEMGPFYSGGPYVETGSTFELLGDDYFQSHYCYYSDSGEFSDEVESALSNYTEEDLENFLGDDPESMGFGKMFCYDQTQETNLVYFSETIRDQYEVICWPTDISDEILCYVDPDSYMTYGEETTEDEVVSEIIATLGTNSPQIADGSDLQITVTLTNETGSAVDGHALEALVMTSSGFNRFALSEETSGVYALYLNAFVAGSMDVYIRDLDTGNAYTTEVEFLPGPVESIQVFQMEQPYETENYSAYFTAALVDDYGNIVGGEAGKDLFFSTTLGELTENYNEETGVWDVSITSQEVGYSEATIQSETEEASLNFSFDSVALEAPKGVTLNETFVVPVYVHLGPGESLGIYDIGITYDSTYLQLVSVSDGDQGDDFYGPEVTITDNQIRLYQSSETGAVTDSTIYVADLLFESLFVGDGIIYANDAVLTTTDEAIADAHLPAEETASIVGVKDTKNACLDAYVLEGADDVNYLTVSTEVAAVNTIFWLAAEACHCPYFLNFSFNYNEISQEEWQSITAYTGNDFGVENQVIEEEEADALAENYFDNDSCVNIFYIPELLISDEETGDWATTGWSSISLQNPKTNHIVQDYSRDYSGRSLGHELLHFLSGNQVDDFDPHASNEVNQTARNQGADGPNNIMNYNSNNTEISPAQCALIDWASL